MVLDTTGQTLEVLYTPCRGTINGIWTDGERKMTNCALDAATLFQNTAKKGLIRAWCGVQQVYIVLQPFYDK